MAMLSRQAIFWIPAINSNAEQDGFAQIVGCAGKLPALSGENGTHDTGGNSISLGGALPLWHSLVPMRPGSSPHDCEMLPHKRSYTDGVLKV